MSRGTSVTAALHDASMFLALLIPGVLVDVNEQRTFQCFLCTVFVLTRRDKHKRQKGGEDESQIWTHRAKGQLSTWNSQYDAKSICLLPCQADPRCIHRCGGRWGPAAEFVSLWTGRRGLCACLQWPALDTYLLQPAHMHQQFKKVISITGY